MRSCLIKAKHTALSGLIVLFLGCDSSSDRSREVSAPAPKPTAEFAIQGSVEFFPANADVIAYPVVNGELQRDAPYASTRTDASGHYQLVLPPAAVDGPLVIEAVAAPETASLVCPLLSGCGNTPFGASTALESPLTMSAPVAALQAGGSYNLTALTTVLTKALSAADASNTAAYSDQLEIHSLRLADRFELFGNLTKQPLYDWTQPEALQEVSIDGLRHSAIGPAALTVWCADAPEKTLGHAFNELTDRLANNELPATSESGFSEVALNEAILAYATRWSEIAPMAALISERRAANSILTLTDEPYAVALTAGEGKTDQLAGVKRFIDDIRQAGTSINQKQLSSFQNLGDLLGADADLLEKMGLELEGINFIESVESERFLGALGVSFNAMMSVLAEHFTFKPITNLVNGINVSYVDFGDFVRVGVGQAVNGCNEQEPACEVDVDISLDLAVEELSTSPGVNYYRITGPVFKLFGHLNHSGVQLIVPQEKPAVLRAERLAVFFGPDPSRPQEDAYRVDLDVVRGQVQLPISLLYPAGDDRANSDYHLEVGAKNAGLRYSSVTTSVGVEVGRVEQDLKQYRLFNTEGTYLNIAGKGNDFQDGPRFGFSIALEDSNGDAELRVNQTVERQCTLASEGRCEEVSNEYKTDGEDAPPPLGLSATALGRTKLDGYAGPVWLKFSGSRVDHTTNAINFLTVSQPGNALWLNGEFNNDGATQLDAYNRQGYYFDIHRDGSMRDGGVYSPAGELVVELKDMGTWIKLTYPDGTFDSI